MEHSQSQQLTLKDQILKIFNCQYIVSETYMSAMFIPYLVVVPTFTRNGTTDILAVGVLLHRIVLYRNLTTGYSDIQYYCYCH